MAYWVVRQSPLHLDTELEFPAYEATSLRSDVRCHSVSIPRRKKTVSSEDRRRIIDAYKDGKDYVAVANELGVRRITAWSVVAKWRRTGEVTARLRGGNRPFKLDDEMRDLVLMIIESDPTINPAAP